VDVRRRSRAPTKGAVAKSYQHPTADLATRPEIGTQAQFRKKKPPKTYRYDSSLDPALSWDGQSAAREQGEALVKRILDAKSLDEACGAAEELARMSRPFLNWAGKAERLSFDVPTLPLFVHERLSTKAILETLKRHKKDQQEVLNLFGDPQHSIADQVLRAYEHRDQWVNRLILVDGEGSMTQYDKRVAALVGKTTLRPEHLAPITEIARTCLVDTVREGEAAADAEAAATPEA
jgi:adenine-specific DNA-methyltransferase